MLCFLSSLLSNFHFHSFSYLPIFSCFRIISGNMELVGVRSFITGAAEGERQLSGWGEGRSVAGLPWVVEARGQSAGRWKDRVYICMYNVYLHVQSHLIFSTTLYILLLGPFNRWGRRGTEHVNIYSNICRAVEHVVHAGLRIPSCVLFLAPCPRSPSTWTEKRHQLLGSQGSLASRSDASPFSDGLSEKGWSPIMWKVVSKASLGSYCGGGGGTCFTVMLQWY